MIRLLFPALLAGPAWAGAPEFGPEFLGRIAAIGAIYLLYLVAAVLAVWAWRRGRSVVATVLAAGLLVFGALIPFVDYQRARLQAEATWDMRVMPEGLPIDGMAFLSDDTVRTPDSALNMFNAPRALYGLYKRAESMAAMAAGPVDLAEFSYFQHVYQEGVYKDRRVIEVPTGERIEPDYIMLSRFVGDDREVLDVLPHPNGGTLRSSLGAQLVILAVDDPSAFDLRTAELVMFVPTATESYYAAPFNPLVRNVYTAATYDEERTLLMGYFCKDAPQGRLDRCRREI